MPKKTAAKRKLDDANSSEDEIVKTSVDVTSKLGRKLNPSATAAANAESKLKFDLQWDEHGEEMGKGVKPLYYLYSESEPGSSKIAAFDIDNTIIVTKSGKTFATNNDDWKWFDKSVPQKLKEITDNGFRVVFITNQAGLEKGKLKLSDMKSKFEAIVSQLDIPVFILASSGETHFRKPATEMWQFLLKNPNKNVSVDMKESYYVGDAAGRAKNWAPGKSKDFSCTDRMFAHNCGLNFLTPEEFFLNQKKVSFDWGSIDPSEVLKTFKNIDKKEKEYHAKHKEIILLVGPPASGKSTFYRRYLKVHNYVGINRDTLQTAAKCLKAAEAALSEGKSVCIDNTNPSKATRAEYIQLAKKYKAAMRCFVMSTQIELCHHLNYVRQNQTKSKVRRIPDVGYNVFKSQFAQPEVSEGFDEILTIDFVPKFDSEDDEKIFKQWTS